MKSFCYYLFFLAFLCTGIQAEISHVILLLEKLTLIQREQPDLFGDEVIGGMLNDLELAVEMLNPPLDNVVRQEVKKKILDFQELHTLYQKKAPRLNAPSESGPIYVDTTYFTLRDEYLRNLIVTGSLIAPNFHGGGSGSSCDCSLYVLKAGDTMTGNLTFADQHGVVFDDGGVGSVLIQAPAVVLSSYTLQLPVNSGSSGQVLASSGTDPDQLYWTSVEAVVTSTIQLYGDVIGSSSANRVKTVCGIPACNLAQTYSLVLSATSANVCGTLVLRDTIA